MRANCYGDERLTAVQCEAARQLVTQVAHDHIGTGDNLAQESDEVCCQK
jgi:hypothetical protein